MIFSAIAVRMPTTDEANAGKLEEIVYQHPALVVAKDADAAQMIVAAELPKTIDLKRVEVRVCPFGSGGGGNLCCTAGTVAFG